MKKIDALLPICEGASVDVMPSYNICILMGNLTKEPELRYTSSNVAVCNFSLAVNRVYTDSQGERQEETTFIDVVAWQRLAEVCAEYLSKGKPVFVEGRLQQRSWETESGKRYKLEVVARSVKFLGSRESEASDDSSDEDVPF